MTGRGRSGFEIVSCWCFSSEEEDRRRWECDIVEKAILYKVGRELYIICDSSKRGILIGLASAHSHWTALGWIRISISAFVYSYLAFRLGPRKLSRLGGGAELLKLNSGIRMSWQEQSFCFSENIMNTVVTSNILIFLITNCS